ncbi:MAG: putative sulfate/molybdate transporter, partial [Rhodospirillales bacterium]
MNQTGQAETGQADPARPAPARNRFGRMQWGRMEWGRMEWAGAFGDLGTLIPFTVAYIGVLKMDAMGVLFGFGAAMVACGFYYRTPFPVQPMKAIGAVAATQAAQTAIITPAAVHAAGLATGLIWLVLGLTGWAERISRLVARPVTVG